MDPEIQSCERIRRLLDCYVNNELLTETNLDILDHLDRCTGCSELLDSRVQWRAMLKQAVETEAPPPELLQNVRAALPRTSYRFRQSFAVAAVVVLALFTGAAALWYVMPSKNSASVQAERILNVGAVVHEQCASEPGFEALGWEYNGLVDVIADEMPADYGIEGAHRCMLDGRLFAHVILEAKGAQVSFVVTEKNGEEFSPGDRAGAFEASGVPVYHTTIRKHQIAAFETRHHLAFLVSDLPAEANLHLASSIAALYAPSVRSTLKEVRNAH